MLKHTESIPQVSLRIKEEILFVWFGWVLWHINLYRLFKSCFYIYIQYDLLTHFVDNILNKPELFLFFLSFFFCTQLNGFKYFYLIRIILFTINNLYAQS